MKYPTLLILAGLFASSGFPVVAQDGAPLTTFGFSGLAENAISLENDLVVGSVAQPDGKVITYSLAGHDFQDNGTVFVCRFDEDGYLDPTFGGDGKSEVNFCTSDDFPTDMKLQPDGKVVCSGWENWNPLIGPVNPSQGVTFRLTTTGSLDPSYGTGGITYVHPSVDGDTRCTALALQPDGKIIGAGRDKDQDALYKLLLFRYSTTGQRDSTFGLNGYALFDTFMDEAVSVALQTDGKIVVAGYAVTGGACYLTRFNTDGTLDNSFGVNGTRSISLFNGFRPKRLIVLADDRILVAGTGTVTSPLAVHVVVARLSPEGALDPSFGSGGIATYPLSTSAGDLVYDMALLPDGRIVLAESVPATATSTDMAILCLAPSGQLVSSFGEGGLTGFTIPGSYYSRAVVVRPDGNIVAAGACPSLSEFSNGKDISLACYVPDDDYWITGAPEIPGRNATVHLYPNPAAPGAAITLSSQEQLLFAQIELISADGQLTRRSAQRVGPVTNVLDGSLTAGLTPGLYRVKMVLQDGTARGTNLIIN